MLAETLIVGAVDVVGLVERAVWLVRHLLERLFAGDGAVEELVG